MAGMDDYRFFAEMRRDSPFWERKQNEELVQESVRGCDLGLPSRTFQGPHSHHQFDDIDLESEYTTDKYIGLGAGLIGRVAKCILGHPFVVLRRQCQVHVKSHRYHVVCVTLLPVVLNLHCRQGLTTLWKGIGSVLIVQGLTLGVEALISNLSLWPNEINQHSSLKMIGKHLVLKCVSLAVMTPFFSASLVETVQSDIASEKPKLLDVFKEGMCRMLSWSAPHTGRMLPVWVLVVPTVCHGVLKYIISTFMKEAALQFFRSAQREEQRRQGAVSKDPLGCSNAHYSEFTATVTGHLVAEVILFPLETVLHRLHLQGTRTIIDNLDSGKEVVPIITGYEGVVDCFQTTVSEEDMRPVQLENQMPAQQKLQSLRSPVGHPAGSGTQLEAMPSTRFPQYSSIQQEATPGICFPPHSNRSEGDTSNRTSILYTGVPQQPHDVYLPKYN